MSLGFKIAQQWWLLTPHQHLRPTSIRVQGQQSVASALWHQSWETETPRSPCSPGRSTLTLGMSVDWLRVMGLL